MLLTPHGLSTQLQGSQASLWKFGRRKGKQRMVWGTLCPECFKPLLSIPLVWKITSMVNTSNDQYNELNVCIPPKFLFWSPLLSLSFLLSCISLFTTPWTMPTGLLCPWNSLGKNTGVGCHFLLQEILSNPGTEPKDQTQVFCTAGRLFTVWATREAPLKS